MKLQDFLSLHDISKAFLSKKLDMATNTLTSIIKRKRDISVSQALKIQNITDGLVTIEDLAPLSYKKCLPLFSVNVCKNKETDTVKSRKSKAKVS